MSYRSNTGRGKKRIWYMMGSFWANPSPILPTFCHGNEVKPWKFEKKLTKIIVRLTREWKNFFGIFWIFLVIFGIFWKSVFQLRICQSDFTGWTHYSFRPFWAIQSWEKQFFSDFWRFLLNRKKFQKIHSFEFWITNYVPKVTRYHLEVDLEASFVM